MKCYVCLTDSVAGRKDYLDLLEVALKSAQQNTSLRMIGMYDGPKGDSVCQLFDKYGAQTIFHEFPFKQELREIYPQKWMVKKFGKEIDYSRIYGAFMRFEIPQVETEDEYVLYTDVDVMFNADIRFEDLPRPKYLAAAPEFDASFDKMTYFNTGVLLLNIEGMKEKYAKFAEMMKHRKRNKTNIFDQGYLNQLCFDDMTLLPLEYNWKPYWGINPEAKIIHIHGMKPGSTLSEAGFATTDSFFFRIFSENSNGYAGYVCYFLQYYDYLGSRDNSWLYDHLQYIYDANQKTSHKLIKEYSNSARNYRILTIVLGVATAAAIFLLLWVLF